MLEPHDSPGHRLAPWFEHYRSRRREHYAGRRRRLRRPRRRSRAIITMVRNEPVFLPLWLGYYSRFFRPEDIYVLDNDTTDGSTENGGFVRIPAPHDCVDALWTLETTQALQHELIERYDAVVVCDVDEFVVPLPASGSLGDYLDRVDEEWVNCLGYELLHLRDREPPLDLRRPIMSQRRWWFANSGYDKAPITTAPLTWRAGFHGRADFHFNPDPDLRLVHLHRMDYDICLERHRARRDRRWAAVDERERWALHNRIADEEEFERWFYEDSCFPDLTIELEEVPEAWRGAF